MHRVACLEAGPPAPRKANEALNMRWTTRRRRMCSSGSRIVQDAKSFSGSEGQLEQEESQNCGHGGAADGKPRSCGNYGEPGHNSCIH